MIMNVLLGVAPLLIALTYRAYKRDEARRAKRTPKEIEDEFDQEIW